MKYTFEIKGTAALGSFLGQFLTALFTMWIWNYEAVKLFGLPPINYWDAFLLIWLFRNFFHSSIGLSSYRITEEKEDIK